MSTITPPLTNVLKDSKSPYLLQHKDNPVAWQEWKPETIDLAKKLDRPIFLSSGYSACHWCHVLAHESFEKEDTAKLMNDYFVNIKLDREERPDIDRVYMTYLQASRGGGGWPLSVFLTPNLEPFFAGTYFPPHQFKSLLARIQEMWEDDREQCEAMGKNVIESLKELGESSSSQSSSIESLLLSNPWKKVYTHLVKTHDSRYGGFTPGGSRSQGPKFPSCALNLEPLARLATLSGTSGDPANSSSDIAAEAREMGIKMLRNIWEGGIHDWAGNGVARYSVDEKWLVPHFEKMLYDQAQLISSACDFAKLSTILHSPGIPEDQLRKDRSICELLAADILDYCLRDLLSPLGGFFGAEDADSAPALGAKKLEGAFYLWTKEGFDDTVCEDAELVGYYLGVQEDGNVPAKHDAHGEMTGKNILHQAHTAADTASKYGTDSSSVIEKVRVALQKLKSKRDETRERPGLDDKILTSWNGLMITALAKASLTLDPVAYPVAARCIDAAEGVVKFIRENMWDETARTLTRSWREGKGTTGQTDDYAYLIQGLLHLYDATGKPEHALFARELQLRQNELFWDDAAGGWFASAPDEHVLIRMKDAHDAAEPSASSVSGHNLMRLSVVFSEEYEQWEKKAEETYLSIRDELEKYPQAVANSVSGLLDLKRRCQSVYVTGTRSDPVTKAMLEALHSAYLPNSATIHLNPKLDLDQVLKLNYTAREVVEAEGCEKPSLRVCKGRTCGLPMRSVEAVKEWLQAQS